MLPNDFSKEFLNAVFLHLDTPIFLVVPYPSARGPLNMCSFSDWYYKKERVMVVHFPAPG